MKILICDDDASYAARCREQLLLLARKHQVEVTIETAVSGKQLLFYADTKFAKVDLIYMDLHMPELSGMSTARLLREKNTYSDIVFYTVDASRAIDAFDVSALHYILKERTDDKKFEEIFLRAVARYQRREVEVLSLSCAGERCSIPISDILYFEVQKRIITVHYRDGSKRSRFEFYSSLSKIEETLYGSGFTRIHRSYLVAEKIIAKRTGGYVWLTTGEKLPVGSAYHAAQTQRS